jgi:transcriptional regulator with XRE-family HTH domain
MYYRIKEARKAAKLTQRELAEKLGIKVSTLSGYEIGAHDPKSNNLAKIAQICNTTVDWLLGIDDSDKPQKNAPHLIEGLDENESRLIFVYRELNDSGKMALLRQASYIYSDPDMKKGGASSATMA